MYVFEVGQGGQPTTKLDQGLLRDGIPITDAQSQLFQLGSVAQRIPSKT